MIFRKIRRDKVKNKEYDESSQNHECYEQDEHGCALQILKYQDEVSLFSLILVCVNISCLPIIAKQRRQ